MNEKASDFISDLENSRISLLQAASSAYENLQNGRGPLLLTFWGNKGIGKTTLLNKIARYLQTNYGARIIKDMVDNHTPQLNPLKETLHRELSDTSPGKTVVLIDNIDELLRGDKDSQAFFDFERDTILPIIEQGDFLILTTSQIELNQWREDDVRVRQVNYHIPALTIEEVAALVSSTEIPAKEVYELTFGQPMVASWLADTPTLTEKKIASKAWEYFLEGIPDDAQRIATIICLLPIFNIYLLQQILKIDEPEEIPYVDCLGWIKEYIRRGLVYWDVSIGSYRFTDNAVRRLLARQILFQYRKKFDEVHRVASEYYQAEATRPGYLHMHLVSAIYHLAQTINSSGSQEIGKQCLNWVKSKINSWLSARLDEVIIAWENGAGEQGIAEEIKALIGQNYFKKITQQIKTAKRNLEVKK